MRAIKKIKSFLVFSLVLSKVFVSLYCQYDTTQKSFIMSKSSFYGILFLVILLVVGFISASNAQTINPATKTLIKTFAADTVDVTALQANGNSVVVDTLADDNLSSIRIVQSIEFVNSKNKNVHNRLVNIGYFDIVPRGTKQKVSLSDHSNQIVTVGNTNIEVRRKYTVVVPIGKTVINEKPTK